MAPDFRAASELPVVCPANQPDYEKGVRTMKAKAIALTLSTILLSVAALLSAPQMQKHSSVRNTSPKKARSSTRSARKSPVS